MRLDHLLSREHLLLVIQKPLPGRSSSHKKRKLESKNEFVADRYEIVYLFEALPLLSCLGAVGERSLSVVWPGGDKPHPYISKM